MSISPLCAGPSQFCNYRCSQFLFAGPKCYAILDLRPNKAQVCPLLDIRVRDLTRRLRLTKPSARFALDVILSVWQFHFRSHERWTPRNFVFFTSFKTLPCRVYCHSITVLFLVILRSSCFSHSWSWSISAWSWSQWSSLSTVRYIIVSSANKWTAELT